jgi:hypothetical protein
MENLKKIETQGIRKTKVLEISKDCKRSVDEKDQGRKAGTKDQGMRKSGDRKGKNQRNGITFRIKVHDSS